MDFLTALPRSLKGHNAIWVIVDRLIKSVHFIPFKVGQSIETLAERYMQEIIKLHGGTSEHCVRSRHKISIPLLAEFIDRSEKQVEIQYCLSFPDKWAV